MANDRDPETNAAASLGAELRRARMAAGIKSQDKLAQMLGYDRSVIAKAETGERPPSEDVMEALVKTLGLGQVVTRLASLARRSTGIPAWFLDWVAIERDAVTLHTWQSALIPGLLQTPEYARAVLASWRLDTDGDIEAKLAARTGRQAILDRDDPPDLCALLDESVLHRCIGSAAIMAGQLLAPGAGSAQAERHYPVGSRTGRRLRWAVWGVLGRLGGNRPAGCAAGDRRAGDDCHRTCAGAQGRAPVRDAQIRRSPVVPLPRTDSRGDIQMDTASGPRWRTSSYSGANGGECVEVGQYQDLIAVRQ